MSSASESKRRPVATTQTSAFRPSHLAATLRDLRRSRGLSLQQVGEATEISPSFLSLIENGKSDLTIGRLVRLVEFYGISLGDVIPTTTPAHEPDVVRIDERRELRSPAEGIDIYMLAPSMNRAMLPMLLEFAPAAHLKEPGRHPGEEWVYVLEGRLTLTLRGAEPRQLEAGEAAYYAADVPHLFANPDPKRPLRIICVDTPPV